MDWSTAQNAIVAWIKAGTGLSRVVWSNQSVPKPAHDFVQVRLAAVRKLGGDELTRDQDLSRGPTASDEDFPLVLDVPGTEIEFTVQGERELTLSIQVHTARAVITPVALLSRLQTSLSLESVRTGLLAAGLAPTDPGVVRDLSALVDTGWEGRASLECRFQFTETLSEFTTFIESAPVDVDIDS